MDFEKIFTENQVPIYLLAISYFVKRYYDLKSKKVEINHSLFQQNKIDAVNNYFKNYARVELMWRQLQILNILTNKLSMLELDNIIWPPINDLKQSVLELNLYFDNDIYNNFNEILENFLSINDELNEIYFYSKEYENIIKKVNRLDAFKAKANRKNEEVLNILSKKIRQSFN